MKEDDEVAILTEIFKIKKQYEDPMNLGKGKLKCPVHPCGKTYRDVTQLKTHMRGKHPELGRNGIELTEYGVFQYSKKALDLTLALGKLFPVEMKKIIRKMKTKQSSE